MDKRFLAIIPVRGGSKGVPGKNIRLLNGKPLLTYTLELAKRCEYLSKIVVSTDSQEIASIAKENGVEVI